MKSPILQLLLLPFLLSPIVTGTLLVDYRGGDAPSVLGNAELEGQDLGCKIINGDAGNAAYIRAELDAATGKPSLHFHRDPHFRRAEVKALPGGTYPQAVENRTYYIGYHFRVATEVDSLVIFQWKKWDKVAEPAQNIPLYVYFESANLTIQYTIPGGTGSNRSVVWTGPLSVGPTAAYEHHLAFAINTANGGTGWLEFYLDGEKQTFDPAWGGKKRLENVYLLTGPTSPKFGIYRGEAAATEGQGDVFCPGNYSYSGEVAPVGTERVFDSWVYGVQVSDGCLRDVAEAGGLHGRF
ncbi:hypothetical protein RUND412_004538 [Rhizina undulata]